MCNECPRNDDLSAAKGILIALPLGFAAWVVILVVLFKTGVL